ncbi:succinate--CoA ligase [ADP-forming] subunit beta [Methylopila jiangsuensis]|uniref:Succinate--CoA ligase [ADP-forming] subunit beta n=1 Tax=Methylopila jiangsuensis TaxID=586230 RepID=A0A9W6JK36_9HYPH|nr:ATP-grasp domain-containing protein [Methylopila jiangsuensis]MDR6285094.1 succinyl-CoA synthetase beta subunit [Methylopila jiangsuensis]GLK77519.1 succinate--CoA ligase [ADP-forming] subunit beta [Methylopila jiangsuensis]
MRLHEFQAKRLLADYGLTAPRGAVAVTPAEAESVARDLGVAPLAVKAQIQAGARGAAGGVRMAHGPSMVRSAAEALLGQKLATAQTDGRGLTVRRVYVEEAVRAERTLYLALLVDHELGALTLLAASPGGEDIEARERAGTLTRERLALSVSAEPDEAEIVALLGRVGLEGEPARKVAALVKGLRRAFVELDASLIEINPLAVTAEGDVLALDVKMTLDDNALFRHGDLASLRDEDEADRERLSAHRDQLNFVQLDGDIGLVSNGAGLGLATLDMVTAAGGRAANFMDIRTTATSLDIAHGFALLLDNPAIRTLLVNVHGGGMQSCDTIAEGLGVALRRSGRKLPVVARLAGLNAEFARSRFANFGCAVMEEPDMGAAARRAVAVAAGRA